MKTEIDKNIKIDKNIQAENIHKGVDEITINDFVAKNDKEETICCVAGWFWKKKFRNING